MGLALCPLYKAWPVRRLGSCGAVLPACNLRFHKAQHQSKAYQGSGLRNLLASGLRLAPALLAWFVYQLYAQQCHYGEHKDPITRAYPNCHRLMDAHNKQRYGEGE